MWPWQQVVCRLELVDVQAPPTRRPQLDVGKLCVIRVAWPRALPALPSRTP
jgi:hypothetical protein